MDRIELAAVPFQTPLPVALECFKRNTRALVVTGKPGGAFIVEASDIAARINEAVDAGHAPDAVTVGEVTPAGGLRRIEAPATEPPSPIGAFITDLEREAFQFAFRIPVGGSGDPTLFSVQKVESGTAIVVTASEGLAFQFRSTTIICRCVGNPVHTFEQRQLKNPNSCNKRHGVAVVCRQIGGNG